MPGQGSAEKSAEQIAWEKAIGERQMENPAFAFQEDTELPNVLIIGDSISVGYTAPVRELLKGKADVFRIPENGGDTERGLANMDQWLGDRKWDVITFNWGLHDLKYMADGKLDLSGGRVREVEAYVANMEKLVTRLKQTGAKLFWVATTPVPEGANGRKPGDAALYNEAAAKVMEKTGVATIDLHGFALPQLGDVQRPKDVHFTDEGSAVLARKVVGCVEKALP